MPRLINVIAERALLGGYAHDATTIEARRVDRAAREALAPQARATRHRLRWVAAAVGGRRCATVGGVVLVAADAAVEARATPRDRAGDARKSAKTATRRERHAIGVKRACRSCTRLTMTACPPACRRRRCRRAVAGVAAVAGRRGSAGADADASRLGVPARDRSLACIACAARRRLDKLFAQGRPALLRLQSGGEEHWALLHGADAVSVRLSLGGDTFDTGRVALEHRGPANTRRCGAGPILLRRPAADGREGPAVGWVGARLTPGYAPAQRPSARWTMR